MKQSRSCVCLINCAAYRRLLRRRCPAIQSHIAKRENETSLDYHRRLVYGKLVDGTLADESYTDLAKRLYGKAYAPDVARRMLYGSRKTLELLDAERRNQIQDKSIMEELDEKLVELKKEQQRFFDQRREYAKLLASDGRMEHLFDSLRDAVGRLNETVGIIYSPWGDIKKPESPNDTEAVLVFSDWHYGLKTENIFNTYDTDTCLRRVQHVVDEAISRIPRTRVASEELVCEQLIQATEILAQSIQELSHYVEETYVYTTYGNHARTVQNKNDSIHRDNMERLIPWWLSQRFASTEDVHIMEESRTEFLFVNAAGHGICATHGDLDSIDASPRLIPALANRAGQSVEYIIHGDKHHVDLKEELGVTARLCGSLCGTDDYANGKRLYSTPVQFMLIVDPEYGPDAEYNLKCE